LQVPALGELVIFNRSYYEAVLVERVHGLIPGPVWSARYGEINAFEEMLTRAGTVILKFFLNVSRAEQKKRLEAREADPEKRWKANPDDWEERKRWKAYRTAFGDMLSKTSTAAAPWFVVPADHKWYRNLVVARTLVARLRPFRAEWERAIRERGRAAGRKKR
ncbi:MAG TPA: polyphosphate kinase 2 family protein, partial [Thermoanaerobaculia bacterium]|nr:polyphosphate kinase 2 family protein [Thermoanaerobaculia bacterium]